MQLVAFVEWRILKFATPYNSNMEHEVHYQKTNVSNCAYEIWPKTYTCCHVSRIRESQYETFPTSNIREIMHVEVFSCLVKLNRNGLETNRSGGILPSTPAALKKLLSLWKMRARHPSMNTNVFSVVSFRCSIGVYSPFWDPIENIGNYVRILYVGSKVLWRSIL